MYVCFLVTESKKEEHVNTIQIAGVGPTRATIQWIIYTPDIHKDLPFCIIQLGMKNKIEMNDSQPVLSSCKPKVLSDVQEVQQGD